MYQTNNGYYSRPHGGWHKRSPLDEEPIDRDDLDPYGAVERENTNVL